jgi:hypothetical protein
MAETMPLADYLRKIAGPALAKQEAEFQADATARFAEVVRVDVMFGYKTIPPIMACKVTA